jgi:O-antigen/teichoic acid export membrane protein
MDTPPLTDAPATQPSLRQRTTRGVLWVAAQAVVTRGVTLVQQLALAWLLAKSDFGLIGLTFTVSAFVNLMSNPGIDAVLVQRGRRYRHWATPAFWLGMTMGLAGAIVMAAMAPAAAWAYGRPELVGLILVMALAPPLQSLQIVPRAQLQIELRFKAVVMLGVATSVLTAVLTIAAAYLGLRAYSFVVPIPIVSLLVAVANWRLARPPIRFRLEFSRWKYLFGYGATVGGTKLLHVFITQADYIVLGLMAFPEAAIGTYTFAFSIAIQPSRLLSGSVPAVLFPSLSQMSLAPEKQVRATLRAMRLLTLVTIPFCLLQILLTLPLFRLAFPPRWLDAVLPCQILTLGLMINATSWPTHSLMLSQGRYRELLWLTSIAAIAFAAMLAAAVWIDPSIVSVAVAVALWHMFHSPLIHWAATRHFAPAGSYWVETYRPVIAGVLAALPCMILQKSLGGTVAELIVTLIVGSLVFAVTYALLIYAIWRTAAVDLVQQLGLGAYLPGRKASNSSESS